MKILINLLCYLSILICLNSQAQVAINNDGSAPDSSSILHIKGGSNNDFYINDASGNVGIGTTDPDCKLEVSGTIHSNSGGIKFPDGTIQTSALNEGGWQTPPRIAATKDYFGGCAIKLNGDLLLFEWPDNSLTSPSFHTRIETGPFN